MLNALLPIKENALFLLEFTVFVMVKFSFDQINCFSSVTKVRNNNLPTTGIYTLQEKMSRKMAEEKKMRDELLSFSTKFLFFIVFAFALFHAAAYERLFIASVCVGLYALLFFSQGI